MKTKRKALQGLDRPPEYFRTPIARGISEGAVDRQAGDDRAGLIRGLAVVTRGQADGHNLWVDETFLQQTVDAITNSPYGAKARFKHPTISGDNLGKFLGRVKNARLSEDVVRADLHFSKTAHKTPDGNLASYVMDLAENDPEAFGVSIQFTPDYVAQDKHRKEQRINGSPDQDNVRNLPHARLGKLRAVDAVDEPAANPDGLFRRGQEIAADAEALLSFALGLTGEMPELVELAIDPDRAVSFVKRFLEEHDLEVVPKSEVSIEENTVMEDKKKEAGREAGLPDENQDKSLGKDEESVASSTDVRTLPPPRLARSEEDIERAVVARERERVKELRELGRDDVSPELVAQALSEGWTVAEAAPKFLEDVRVQHSEPVRVVADRGEALNEVLADAILLGGDFDFVDINDKRRREAEQFSGIGFQDLGRILIKKAGLTPPLSTDRLFESAVSTADLPNVLGSTLRRALHKAYSEYPSVWAIIAAPREVKDFRTYTDIKLSEFAQMAELGDAGKFEHDTLVESTETYKAKTYGKAFALTRKVWINDDLGAFRDIPAKLGRAAARNIDDLGFALLVSNSGVGPVMTEDSKNLFSTTHETANYQTGTGTVLADPGLVAARLLMRKIKHQGLNIEARPRFLLVPPDLEDTADRLVKARDMLLGYRGTTDAGPTYLPAYNPHQGSLEILVKASLSDATNGTTAWYLIADPAEVPSLLLIYLRGNRAPTLERKDPSDVLGIGWRVYHDAGVAAVDWRGLVRSKGAA